MSADSGNGGRIAPRGGFVAHTGASRTGFPLSLNRPPADDLKPWVARMVAAKIDAQAESHVFCGMLNDIPYIRSLIGGDWTARTADGLGRYRQQALLFGPQSKYMEVSCTGRIFTAGIGLRPGALHALSGMSAEMVLDRIVPCDDLGLPQDEFAGMFSPDDDPETWLLTLEDALRRHIIRIGARPPEPISCAFDLIAFADPTISLTDYAETEGIGLKRLERIVKRDFGLTPKQVLRRARALDMASLLCGIGEDEEEAELELRFSDQSHLIKEFIAFFDMTPRQFIDHPKPLLPLNLETRQARRLEELNRLGPGAPPPWRKE